ncbi:hypothetical protein TrST_g7004 [Triparma strigata]|uniref:Uncharacterized protein n=1 Tax=Triparma strigata TaxID=1606541 RepID=A0A9W7F544_9STRA|nr:hypothetical protein TrST_g7004 [Triparma strigata]
MSTLPVGGPPPSSSGRKSSLLDASHRASSKKGRDTLAKLRDKFKPKEYNFVVGEKKYAFSKTSLLIFKDTSTFRKSMVKLMVHPMFDNVILTAIALNSVMLAVTDYSTVRLDVDEDSDLYGLPDTRSDKSYRNYLQESLDPVFSILFILECAVKLVAMGFYSHENSYLRDSWNCLDFLIVITSLIGMLNIGDLNVSAIRAFRVLRPLKTLSALPGLQLIVRSLLASIPALTSVIVLLVFVFTIFGILGTQIFLGLTHQRCRVTPYPVSLDYNPILHGSNYSEYKCLSGGLEVNYDELEGTSIDKEDSPWHINQDCYWPHSSADERACSFDTGGGAHKCVHDSDVVDEQYWTWCGSNYDAWGNVRFKGDLDMVMPEGYPLQAFTANDISVPEESHILKNVTASYMKVIPEWHEGLNFGLTNFDDFPHAFIGIFQSITMEGWVDIMYFLQDAGGYFAANVFFGILIVFGSFFVLNLLLAVLEENYSSGKDDQEAEQDEQDEEEEEQDNAGKDNADVGVGYFPPFRKIADNSKFQTFITSMIVVNTVVLACESYPMAPSADTNLEIINFVLTLLFAIEMVVKVGGYGWKRYLGDTMNCFDGVIVFISVVELMIMPPNFIKEADGSGVDIGGVSALRSFRLFRIFKLAREWVSMRIILHKIMLTAIEISNFSVLLGLFMYIYALIGMQFFANRFKFDDDGLAIPIGSPHPQTNEEWHKIHSSRANFDDFHFSFISVFQILSGENWNVVMYDGWRSTSAVSTIYFVSLITFGMFIVMTLFLAILLNNFGSDDDDHAAEEEEKKELAAKALENIEKQRSAQSSPSHDSGVAPVSSAGPLATGLSTTVAQRRPSIAQRFARNMTLNLGDLMNGDKDTAKELARNSVPAKRKRVKKEEEKKIFPLEGKALYVLGPENALRIQAANIVAHPKFDSIVLVLIVVSSVMLAIDDPLGNPDSGFATALSGIDKLFTVLFIIEMVLKIVTMGFIFQPGSYLRDSWNILDFVVVCISILLLFSDGNSSLAGLRSLRAFRAFRPLRMINRAPGLKLIVNAMFASIPDVMNVGAVCTLFFLIFSIVGVTLLKGQLRECQGPHFRTHIEGHAFMYPEEASGYLYEPYNWTTSDSDLVAAFSASSSLFTGLETDCPADMPCCVAGFYDRKEGDLEPYNKIHPNLWGSTPPTSMDVCECLGGTWDLVGCDGDGCTNQVFDNVGSSMLAFFEISSTEGWVDVMNYAQDTRGIGMQPARDVNKYISMFFVIFMLIGCYLVMNLFVGVIIDHFNEMRKEAEGDLTYLTEDQQAWVKTQQIAIRMKPKKKIFPPGDFFGNWCHSIVLKKWFEHAIMFCIVVNTVVMMIGSYGDSSEKVAALEGMNYLFAAIFTIEMIMKLAAMHNLYFHDSWNRFDFVIVMGTLVGLFLKLVSSGDSSNTQVTTVIRTFRIGRIFRLVNGAESLNQLFNTLLLTIPGLVNIGMLLILLYFIFSVMAVQLFATAGFNGAYNQDANFRNFGTAFMTLLRFSTGENWNGFMHDLANGPEDCNEEIVFNADVCGFADKTDDRCNAAFEGLDWYQDVGGCGKPVIKVFLIIFQLLVGYVFLNLFIGIILEGFDTADETKKSIKPEDFERFTEHWQEFDPHATFYIDISALGDFVQTLYAPWGFGDYVATNNEVRAKITELDLKVTKDMRVHFKDVLMGLSKEAVKTEFLLQKMAEHNIEMDFIHRASAPLWHKVPRVTAEPGADLKIGHHYAAEIVQQYMKKYILGKGAEGRKGGRGEGRDRDQEAGEVPVEKGHGRGDIEMQAVEETRLPGAVE